MNVYGGVFDVLVEEAVVTLTGAPAQFVEAHASAVTMTDGSSQIVADNTSIDVTGGNLTLTELSNSHLTVWGGRHSLQDGGMHVVSNGEDSTITIRGGEVLPTPTGGGLPAVNGLAAAFIGEGQIPFVGSNFMLGGLALQTLLPGEEMVISQRDAILSGLLQDGTGFRFPIADHPQNGFRFRVIQVPEPLLLVLFLAPQRLRRVA